MLRAKLQQDEAREQCIQSPKRQKSQMKIDDKMIFIDGMWYDDAKQEKEMVRNRKVEEAAERTGNESRPQTETSVYVRYAVVITPPTITE